MQLLAGTLPSQIFSSQCIGEGSKMVEPLPNATDVGRRSRSATDWNPQGPHITAKAVMMTSWNDDDADAEHPQTCSLPGLLQMHPICPFATCFGCIQPAW